MQHGVDRMNVSEYSGIQNDLMIMELKDDTSIRWFLKSSRQDRLYTARVVLALSRARNGEWIQIFDNLQLDNNQTLVWVYFIDVPFR